MSATPAWHVFFSVLLITQVGKYQWEWEHLWSGLLFICLPVLLCRAVASVADNVHWQCSHLYGLDYNCPPVISLGMKKNVPSRCCRQRSHWYVLDYKCQPVISIGMKKKRAEQVLQTTFSLIWFEIHLPTCNIIRNEKKTCRAGVADNALIYMVWNSFAHL